MGGGGSGTISSWRFAGRVLRVLVLIVAGCVAAMHSSLFGSCDVIVVKCVFAGGGGGAGVRVGLVCVRRWYGVDFFVRFLEGVKHQRRNVCFRSDLRGWKIQSALVSATRACWWCVACVRVDTLVVRLFVPCCVCVCFVLFFVKGLPPTLPRTLEPPG